MNKKRKPPLQYQKIIINTLGNYNFNKSLIKLRNTTIKEGNYKIDTKKCFANEILEDHILNDRVEAVKKYDVNSTPTIIINEKKFEKPLTFKNLQKAIEKLL